MMTVTQNNVYVHSSPPKAISGQGAAIRNSIRNGDLDKLESVILDGQGARLLGLMESTSDPKVKAFLKSVPSYMAKVDLIHDAVIRGSLRETQALLDKRKFATGKDAVGRGLGHKAVLYNHKSLLDWLGRKFPEVVHLRDNEGRTPLHYTAAALQSSTPKSQSPSSNNDLYQLLLSLGASPDIPDIHGRKPPYYQSHPEDLDIESPFHQSSQQARSFSRNKQLSQRRISPTTPKLPQTQSVVPPNSVTRAQIRIWIHERDISKLEQIVWAGQGPKLLLETTNNSKVRRFLDNVPHLLGIIKQVHGASISGNVAKLKALKEEVARSGIVDEVFMAKDQYGMTGVMKAVGIGHREVVEWFAYEFPEQVKSIRDSAGRSVVDYSAISPNNGMTAFLSKLLGTSHQTYNTPELTEVDQRRLRSLPDAPRVVGVLGEWDRGSDSSSSRENNKAMMLKRKQSSVDEFGSDSVDGKSVFREEVHSSGGKLRKEVEEQETAVEDDDYDEKVDIVDVGDGYVVDELLDKGESTKYGLDADNVVLEGMDFEVDLDNTSGELELELERIINDDEQRDDGEEEQEMDGDAENLDHAVLSSSGRRESPSVATPLSSKSGGRSAVGTPFPKNSSATEHASADQQLRDMTPPQQFDEYEDDTAVIPTSNTVTSITEKEVDALIEQGNMESLVTLVLDGKGHLLLNKQPSSGGQQFQEVNEFLANVPAYMAKIASIHSAANNGNLRDLQSLLDRKRLAQAKDEHGRIPLHMAVLGGHGSVVRYLVGNYDKQSTNTPDANGRTPLHYAATLPDQGAIYKILIQSGSDPNVNDVLDNTPGVYLRRRDLLTNEDLMQFTTNEERIPSSTAVVDTWERPITPNEELTRATAVNDRLYFIQNNQTTDLEIDPTQLQILDNFYNQISKEESVWVNTWRKLTGKSSENLAKVYVRKYLPRELYEQLKVRVTPRFNATLFDCIKFYPQYFLIAPDPHCYWVWRELFLGAVKGVNEVMEMKESLLGSLKEMGTKGIPNVDVAAKFVREVRVRVSRNLRPYPFVSVLRKEGLEEVLLKLESVIAEKLAHWERVDWERLMGDKEERNERELGGRSVVAVEATKISRFWPKFRYIWISPENDVQLWIHAQDHLDFIVKGRYGRVGPLLERMKEIYDIVSSNGGLDYHSSSEVGFLTADPFRCGTGMKITFRVRLPYLMSTTRRSQFLTLLDTHFLCISKWHGASSVLNPSSVVVEINADDWVEVENVQTFGLNEVELAMKVVNGIGEVLKVEESIGREIDLRATNAVKK